MTKKHLIDTSALLSMLEKRDEKHKQAKSIAEELEQDERNIPVITDYILDETLTLLKKRVGHKEAIKFGRLVFSGKTKLKLIYLSNKIIREAFQIFTQYSDKDFSFTDCTSFLAMKYHNIAQAFTFDKHFEQAGFEVIKDKNSLKTYPETL